MIILTDRMLKEIKEKPYLVRLFITPDSDPLCYTVLATSIRHAEAIVVTQERELLGKGYEQIVAEEWNGRPFSFLDGYLE